MASYFRKFYLSIHGRENHLASTTRLFRLFDEGRITLCTQAEISVESVRVSTSLVCSVNFILK